MFLCQSVCYRLDPSIYYYWREHVYIPSDQKLLTNWEQPFYSRHFLKILNRRKANVRVTKFIFCIIKNGFIPQVMRFWDFWLIEGEIHIFSSFGKLQATQQSETFFRPWKTEYFLNTNLKFSGFSHQRLRGKFSHKGNVPLLMLHTVKASCRWICW